METAFEDRPVPSIKRPSDVLVRINVTGICGSDIEYWRQGQIHGNPVLKSTMIPSHEAAGIIVMVGPTAKLFKPGDRVVLEPGVPCRICVSCKSGKYNLCHTLQLFAHPPFDGMLSKYFVIPEDFCVPLPVNVTLEEGVLVEPLAIAVHTCSRAEISPGNSIVVFGAGSTGLLCAVVAKTFGATKVLVVDDLRTRLDFASVYTGANVFYLENSGEPGGSARSIIERFSLGHGANIVIETSGTDMYVKTAIHVLRNGGTYVQAALFAQHDMLFPIVQLCRKEIKAKGSFRYGPGDYALAVDLLESGAVSVKEFITRIFEFEDADSAFKMSMLEDGKYLINGPKD